MGGAALVKKKHTDSRSANQWKLDKLLCTSDCSQNRPLKLGSIAEKGHTNVPHMVLVLPEGICTDFLPGIVMVNPYWKIPGGYAAHRTAATLKESGKQEVCGRTSPTFW